MGDSISAACSSAFRGRSTILSGESDDPATGTPLPAGPIELALLFLSNKPVPRDHHGGTGLFGTVFFPYNRWFIRQVNITADV